MSIETTSPNVANTSNRDIEPFRCEKCGIPFTTGDDLRRHTQLTHKGSDVEAKIIRRRTATKIKSKEKAKSVKSDRITKRKSKSTAKRGSSIVKSTKSKKSPRRSK